MGKKTRQVKNDKGGKSKSDRKLIALIQDFVRSDLEFIGRPLLKILRVKWHRRSIRAEAEPREEISPPIGPFLTARRKQLGDLLLFVPRHINSYLIDDLTGSYGYSHAAVDSGEIDLKTLKPVMIEVMPGQKVARKFQDEYGQRPFARVPLARTGVNAEKFVTCVKSKLDQPYDGLEAITLGEIQDPAKQVCSGIVADCLPEKDRRRIAWARRLGLLRGTEASVHSHPEAPVTRAFISPNGFARYYGAPRGKSLSKPDVTIPPHPMAISVQSVTAAATQHHGWKLAAGLGGAALVAVWVLRKRGYLLHPAFS